MKNTLIECKEKDESFSLVMIDIDHFKPINDNYGHLVGDEILKQFSNIISTFIRENDTVSRWGGEEFVIILPKTSLDIALDITNRLKSTIENSKFTENLKITASFGVAGFDKNNIDGKNLISIIDRVLYYAKNNGRNCIGYYDHDTDEPKILNK